MIQRIIPVAARILSVVVLASQLFGCGGGDSGSSEDTSGSVSPEAIFSGSVGDGPIVGATVNIYDKNGKLLVTEMSDSSASYSARIKAPGKAYPLTIEVTDGTDLVTGRAPDFYLSSVVSRPSEKRVNINPFTTLIVESARSMAGGLNSENIAYVKAAIVDQLNFGLDPALVADPIGTAIDDANIANIVKSSEALGEMIRRASENLISTGTVSNANEVVRAIADDISDGILDGLGGDRANGRVAAVATLTSAQVLIESLSNNLKVDGVIATDALDNSILITQPTAAGTLTGDVRVNVEMLEQAREAVAAARMLAPGIELTTISEMLNVIQAGSLPSEVESTLPGDTSQDLDQVIALANSITDEELAVVYDTTQSDQNTDDDGTNDSTNSDSTTSDGTTDSTTSDGTTGSTNSAPAISGTPDGSVLEGNQYAFQPAASDVDGDSLTFTINNRPSWASFNSDTGRLVGTPGNAAVGTHDNISITVSDGTASASVGPFSIVVINTNDAPRISGTPATSVDEGSLYVFQPESHDKDGDSLTFSISNRPAWASFDSSNGSLSGTPGSADAGTYSNIVISASDGSITVSLPAFSIVVNGNGAAPALGSATLEWAAPAARTDGNSLDMLELAGYTLYYGTTSGNYPNSVDINDPYTTSVTVSDLPVGTYYFVITARDTDGRESGHSNVTTRLVQ